MDYTPRGGETYQQMYNRAEKFFSRLKKYVLLSKTSGDLRTLGAGILSLLERLPFYRMMTRRNGLGREVVLILEVLYRVFGVASGVQRNPS